MADLTKGPFDGYVVDRNDPKGLARVRASLPGTEDEKTGWLFPDDRALGDKKGEFNPPDKGAEVNVVFIEGNPNNGRYRLGHWGEGEIPSGAVASDDGDHKVFDDGVLRVERDERSASKGYRLKHSPTDTLLMELDANTLRMKVVAPTSLNLEAVGEVRITGGAVSINGRPVLKSGEPI